MALRIELMPFEQLFIGADVVLRNSGRRATFVLEGPLRLLRQRDFLTQEAANTTLKEAYLCIQRMYLENDRTKYQSDYERLIDAIEPLDPVKIGEVKGLVDNSLFYRALKKLKKLTEHQD